MTTSTYKPASAFVDTHVYDRAADLSPEEVVGLRRLLSPPPAGRPLERFLAKVEGCDRLTRPLADALVATSGDPWWKWRAMHTLLRACAIEQAALWGWDTATWRRYLSPAAKWTPATERPKVTPVFRWAAAARQYMVAAAYLLGIMPDPLELPSVRWLSVAEKVFGVDLVGRCVADVETVISSWGYSWSRRRDLRSLTGEALIRCGHPALARIADIDLGAWRREEPHTRRGLIYLLSRALTRLGVLADAIEMEPPGRQVAIKAAERDVPPEWRQWVER